jgi:hypothetical protein
MTSVEQIHEFVRRVTQWGKTATLYSHDAGVDASSDYNNQETLNAQLHLGCAIAGLEVLAAGGLFIAKQYTAFKPLTRGLIVLYSQLFAEFYLYKPVTSRAANSEVYLIGVKYIGAKAAARTIVRLYSLMARIAPLGPEERVLVDPLDDTADQKSLNRLDSYIVQSVQAQLAALDLLTGDRAIEPPPRQLLDAWLDSCALRPRTSGTRSSVKTGRR